MQENRRYRVEYDEMQRMLFITERHAISLGEELLQTKDKDGVSGWEIRDDGIYFVNKASTGELLQEKKLTKEEFEQEIIGHLSQAGEVIFPLPQGTY